MTTAILLVVLSARLQQQPSSPIPTQGHITGVVVSAATGAPLADVRVTIVEGGHDARTGADGRFDLPGVTPGSATLTVSTIGYIFIRRRITVPEAGALDLTIPLAEGTGTYEETVTVSPDASQPTGQVRELTSGALQDLRGVAADDPVRAVQALPGVATGDDFQAEFSVHGAAFRQVGIVIDGVATPLLFHSIGGGEDSGSIAMINTDVLAHASLGMGAQPAHDGDWLGATLSFDIREGSRDRLTVRGAISGTSASTVLEGPIGRRKRGSWLVSVRKSYVDWLIRRLDPAIGSTVGFADTQSKIVYDLTKRQQVQLLVIGGNALYRDDASTGTNEIFRATSSSLLSSASWRYTAAHAFFTQRLSVIDSRYREYGQLSQEEARGDTRVIVWRGGATVPLKAWTFDVGLSRERQRTSIALRNFTAISATSVRLRTEQALADIRTLTSGWAQLGGRVKGTGVTAGVRATGDSLTDVTTASPWVLAERSAGPLRLSAGASRVIQFPTIESVAQAASPLKPERAWMADVTARLPLSLSVFVSASLFRRNESDVLRLVNENQIVNGVRLVESTFPTVASTIAGTSQGVDLAVERRADRGPTGWIGYSWAHTRDRDVVTGETFDGDFDQRHTLNIVVQQRLSYRLKVSAKFRYGSNFPFVGYYAGSNDDLRLASLRNQVRLPAYARLDLDASRTFTFNRNRLTLFVEVMNATAQVNYGPAEGSIRSNLAAVGFSEKLFPLVPSAGVLMEF